MQHEQSTRAPGGRRRSATNACLAVSATLMALFAAGEVRDTYSTDQGGIAQSLHQSAWNEALDGQSVGATWPWQSVSSRMSHLPAAKVRRLGLSASLRDMSDVAADYDTVRTAAASPDGKASGPHSKESEALYGDIALGDVALGDEGSGKVRIGDSITFTANDGATCVYQVTGRPVVDPHLDSGHAEGAKGDAVSFVCSTLDSAIMRAARKAQETLPPEPTAEPQRKL